MMMKMRVIYFGGSYACFINKLRLSSPMLLHLYSGNSNIACLTVLYIPIAGFYTLNTTSLYLNSLLVTVPIELSSWMSLFANLRLYEKMAI